MGFKIITIHSSEHTILCDWCSKDWANDEVTSGGFLFLTKAFCPDCHAQEMDEKIVDIGEEDFIKGYCPSDVSFSTWVLLLRFFKRNVEELNQYLKQSRIEYQLSKCSIPTPYR